MKSSLLLIIVASLLVIGSCKKDKDDDPINNCGNNWSPAIELQEELAALSDAIATYSNDQSIENCNAYKQAYLNYLSAIRDWEECYIYIGQQQEFLQEVEEAEQEVNEIECL